MSSFDANGWIRKTAGLALAAAVLILPAVGAQEAGSKPASAADAKKGKELYLSHGCYECHGTVGQGGSAGPRIAPPRTSEEAVARYLRQPSGQMPPYTAKVLPDADVADIFAYLKSLPEPPKNIPLLK